MKRIFTLLALMAVGNFSYGQTTEDYTVELSAVVSESPVKITLNWKSITFSSPTYYIWKKSKTSTTWGMSVATLPTGSVTWTDTAVIIDSAYEYIVKAVSGTLNATGYIYAGIRNPAIHNRGIVELIVDSTFSDSCASNIKTLMNDLSGDGWQVRRHDFPRSATDATIKAAIVADCGSYLNVKAVLLLGHVAVPYSGDQNPDGHPDHLGAWPADIFYGSISGSWTDATVNDIVSSYPANQNIPGDGKYDQIAFSPDAELQVSRIDFYNMPAFSATEVEMMRRYLDKDHAYKMDTLAMRHRAIICDNFGAFSGEAFAANGWRNFAPLVGTDSMASVPSSTYISTLASGTYQWAYGCGGGSFTSAGGIGNTSDFATNPVNGIFTMMFGSYFGDWNVTNNFLRAQLCSSTPALTCCWAGRPNWFMHHMALGENIGYSARLSQNNNGSLYTPTGYGNHWVHVALMGDLSLRTDYVKQPSNLVITGGFHAGASLSWTASPDPAVIGYYIYRADSAYGAYTRVSTSMVTGTTFTDATGISGLKYYQVRPVKLQLTPSGKYYNLGIGLIDSATISFPPLQVVNTAATVAVNVFPNPTSGNLNVVVNANTATVATMYVVNMQGQRMNMVTKQLSNGDNAYMLNVTNLAPGMYALVVETEGVKTVRNWVKM